MTQRATTHRDPRLTHIMSNDIDEEKQLKEALAKLQSQIEEQKHLVERLLELKQRKLKHKATNGNSQVANVRAMINPVTNSNKVPIGKIRKPGNNSTNNANNVPHVNDILPQKLTSLPPSNKQNQYEEPDMHNPFIKKILMNRAYHRGLNRLFFSGYKFVIIHNDRCLCLLSTNHEITKKALRNAYDMPAFITYKGKNYIKQPNGNYHLETPAAMYVPAVYVANNSIINKILTPIFFHTNGDLNTAKRGSLYSKYDENKNNMPCKFYTSSGVCPRLYCIYKHDPNRIALCPTMQANPAHKCLNKICHYSHTPTQFNSPSCKFFQLDKCNNENCIFTHKKENPSAPICRPFACSGYCEDGLQCRFTHTFQCPDLKEYGRCLDPHKCTCLHNSNMVERDNIHAAKIEMRNKDNDNVIQIVYDKNDAAEDESCKGKLGKDTQESESDSDDDNVEFIVGPIGQEFGSNSDYVKL